VTTWENAIGRATLSLPADGALPDILCALSHDFISLEARNCNLLVMLICGNP